MKKTTAKKENNASQQKPAEVLDIKAVSPQKPAEASKPQQKPAQQKSQQKPASKPAEAQKPALTDKELDYIIKAVTLTDSQLKKLDEKSLKGIENNLLKLQPKLKGLPESKPVEKLISKLEALLDKEEAEAPAEKKSQQKGKKPAQKPQQKPAEVIEATALKPTAEAQYRVIMDDNDSTAWDIVYISEAHDTICLVSADYSSNLITSYKTFIKKHEVRTARQTVDILRIEKIQ